MADEAEVQRWIDELGGLSNEKRVTACKRLAEIGDPRAVPHIVSLNSHENSRIRLAARDALIRLGEGDIVQLVEDTLCGSDNISKSLVLLKNKGDFRVVDYLVGAFQLNRSPNVGHRLCRALRFMYKGIGSRGRQWLCRECLTRFHLWFFDGQLNDMGSNAEADYGLLTLLADRRYALLCRTCQMARYGVPGVETVVAVLDGDQSPTPSEELVPYDGIIEIHWCPGRPLFDFDVVDVHAAPDQHVEAFCMMAGNDPDKPRHRGYRKLPCRVDSTCGLSAATLNMLDATFGKVMVEPRDGCCDG